MAVSEEEFRSEEVEAMSVIINELEVVVETPAPPQPSTSAAPAQAPPQTQLRPVDLMDILERRDRAEWRLVAH